MSSHAPFLRQRAILSLLEENLQEILFWNDFQMYIVEIYNAW